MIKMLKYILSYLINSALLPIKFIYSKFETVI